MKKTEIIPAAIATLIATCVVGITGIGTYFNCNFDGFFRSYFHCGFLSNFYLVVGFVGLLIFLGNLASFGFKNEKKRVIVHKANLIYLLVAIISIVSYLASGGSDAFI